MVNHCFEKKAFPLLYLRRNKLSWQSLLIFKGLITMLQWITLPTFNNVMLYRTNTYSFLKQRSTARLYEHLVIAGSFN